MSAKNPANKGQRNLDAYFQKTPKRENAVESKSRIEFSEQKQPLTPISSNVNKKRRRASVDKSDTMDSPIKVPLSNGEKRRRIVISDEDDEDIGIDKYENKSIPSIENFATPVASTSLARSIKSSITPKTANRSFKSDLAESFICSFRADSELDSSTNFDHFLTRDRTLVPLESRSARFPHLEYDFLKPEKIRDAQKRRPDDPDYNPRTLFVPETFLSKQPPNQRMWWDFKSKNFDTVLFYKVGKFYEMHHMDAVIAVECLNLKYMNKEIAHSGFPEVSYGRFVDQLLTRGYKVARVEQVETPEERDERNKRERTKDNLVKRELCRITTLGTKTGGLLDGTDDVLSEPAEASNFYLMAIKEKYDEKGISTYGVCFIDTSVGTFKISQFLDDDTRSYLRTLIAHNQPVQLLYERKGISQATQIIFDTMLAAIIKDPLKKEHEFLTVDKTLSALTSGIYLGPDIKKWPDVLQLMLSESGLLQPKPEYALSLSAFGAILWYLKRSLIDVDIVTMKNFEEYVPPSLINHKLGHSSKPGGSERWKGRHLVLDGLTISNLHVVPPISAKKNVNLRDPTALKTSLYGTINKCLTSFGKRLLRQWVCAPSCCPLILNDRQDACEFMLKPEAKELKSRAIETLRKLPDLERLLQKIHSLGLHYRATEHPDSRANFFEVAKYNKRKIMDFINILNGFDLIAKFIKFLPDCGFKDVHLLNRCIGEQFPNIDEEMDHFQKAFDKQQAIDEGKIVPKPGVDEEYEQACIYVRDCEAQIREYLDKERKAHRSSHINLVNTKKERHLLEVPLEISDKLGAEYEFKGQRKGFKKFMTKELQQLIATVIAAENQRDAISDDMTRKMFADFASRSEKWKSVVSRIAVFDCILSLARYAETCGLEVCRPKIDFEAEQPFIDIKSGYHPSLVSTLCASDGKTFIPNDTKLGGNLPSAMLLTGPNMGGKSTLMRQVASLVILAQIGSMVPAKSMNFSPVDRIFSRIGANDRTIAGQSTFFVELNETRVILSEATRCSLVIIDELGRGTSTHDGTAIAEAVLSEIADKIQCRTFFSTHYHALCYMIKSPNVRMAHMACVVENENVEDPTSENITFLYTLTDGICPKSYGFWCAIRSGIDRKLVRKAYEASHLLGQKADVLKRSSQLRSLRESSLNKEITIEKLRKMIATL